MNWKHVAIAAVVGVVVGTAATVATARYTRERHPNAHAMITGGPRQTLARN